MKVRSADGRDVDAVVALVESAYRGESSRAGWTTEADLLDGRRTDADAVTALVAAGALLVAVDGAELIGCCQLELRTGGAAYFGTFAVVPARQGGGTGSALMAEAERRARAAGVAVMEMTVLDRRPELLAWYARRGYVRTGEVRPFPYGDERFGLPRRDDLAFVVLSKDLSAP